MAKRTPTAREGETRFGPNEDNLNINQGILYVEAGGPDTDLQKAGKGSVLALDAIDVTGLPTTIYFFVTSAGILKWSTTLPTNTELDGTAVNV